MSGPCVNFGCTYCNSTQNSYYQCTIQKAKQLSSNITKSVQNSLNLHLFLLENEEQIISENEEQRTENSFVQRSAYSSFYIEKATRSDVKEEGQNLETLSDVEKILSRCSDRQIIPFENMYGTDRLARARKVSESRMR